MRCSRSILFVLLPAAATGQTFVVDAANGPGTHYTSIAAAVLAVPDGATLLVQPGTYSEFQVDAKGLTILGGPGVVVTRSYPSEFAIELANTSATQAVTIRGVTAGTDSRLLRASGCAGRVLLEDLTGHAYCPWAGVQPFSYFPPGLELQSCAQVLLRAVHFPNSGIEAVGSHLVVERCSITAPDGTSGALLTLLAPRPALDVRSGSVQVSDSVLAGGDGLASWYVAADAPAIGVTASAVRVQGGSLLHSGTWGGAPAPAIAGTGTLRLDPNVVLNASSTTLIGAGISTTVAPLADIRGWSAPLGGTLVAEALGPFGQFTLLVVGFPGPAIVVPGIADPFWLSAQPHAFLAMGTPQPGTPLTASVPVPNHAGLRGLVLAWQSVTAGPAGLEASNPSWTLVN